MLKHYDVIVIGGGPSGALAAWAAARQGARTALIEEGPFLGGMLTRAGVGPQMSYHAGDHLVVAGLPQLLIERMIAAGFSPGHIHDPIGFVSTITPFDPDGLKIIWEQSLLADGVDLHYYSRFLGCDCDGEKIKSLSVLHREGITHYQAQVYIDGSGGALATQTPCSWHWGRRDDGLTQPMTMNFRLGGVRRDLFIDYVQKHPEDMYEGMHLEFFQGYPRLAVSGGFSLVQAARRRGDFSIDRDRILLFEGNEPGTFLVNMSRIAQLRSDNSHDLTRAEIEGRRQILELFHFLKRDLPGFSEAYLISSGPFVGIREGLRIQAAYQLQAEDLIQHRRFDDAIACGGYPVDIHSPDGAETSFQSLTPGSWYQIPYRSLYSPAVRNMLVPCRSLGAEHEALAAVRVSPILEAIGQAAGTAAALAAQSADPDVRQISVGKLQENLCADGAFLEPYLS